MFRPDLRSFMTALVLVVASASAACPKSSGTGSGTRPSSAEIRWRDGGGAELVGDGRAVAVPAGDLAAGARPEVMQDEGMTRLAYPTSAGDARLVYRVGDRWFVGSKTKSASDLGAAPALERAYGALFEAAGSDRAALVTEVKRVSGEEGVVKLLSAAAGVDAPEWDAAYDALPEPRKSEVKSYLAALLEKGAPTAGLRRAVVLVPLGDAGRAAPLAARVRELLDPPREPRAAAVMVRAVAVADRDAGAALGCDVLRRGLLDASSAPADGDPSGREALVDAATLAVAHAALEGGAAECKEAEAELGDDRCMPWFRCGPDGPLSAHATTKQDEPLCTKPELAKAAEADLRRAPKDVVAVTGGPRPSLWAFALLVARDRVPAAFVAAHERRRYALTQPKEPACEGGALTPGTPCRCDEAVLRDQACRHGAGHVSVGVCGFSIDDKQKKITNVVASLPP